MNHVAKCSLYFDMSPTRESTDVRIEARPRDGPQCVEVGDAWTRKPFAPAERYFLRDRTDGRRHFHDEDARQIAERHAAPQQEHGATPGRLWQTRPPDLELMRASRSVARDQAARFGFGLLVAFRESSLWSSQPSRSAAVIPAATGWSR